MYMERVGYMIKLFDKKSKPSSKPSSEPKAKSEPRTKKRKRAKGPDDVKQISPQEWLPVKDISKNILYRRDGYIVSGLSIHGLNFHLLSKREKKAVIMALKDSINGLKHHFQFFCIGRPVDLDSFIKGLEEKKASTENTIRKKLLQGYARQAAEMAAGGDCLERKFYILFEQKFDKYAVDELTNTISEFASSLSSTDIHTELLTEQDIIAVNFLFSHPIQSAYERPPITRLSELPMIVDIDALDAEEEF